MDVVCEIILSHRRCGDEYAALALQSRLSSGALCIGWDIYGNWCVNLKHSLILSPCEELFFQKLDIVPLEFAEADVFEIAP